MIDLALQQVAKELEREPGLVTCPRADIFKQRYPAVQQVKHVKVIPLYKCLINMMQIRTDLINVICSGITVRILNKISVIKHRMENEKI